VSFFNLAYGNPYYNPHVERPYDTPAGAGYVPQEHPLAGVALMCELHRQVHEALPEAVLIATGLSWLRQFFPCVAAAMVGAGEARLAGVGRMALAYPDFARDLLERGELAPEKVCITCSGCSQLMRGGGPVGCVVRDREVYRPLFLAQKRNEGQS
jgi:2,4-dienoyl-CoA reductase-like NADH-dependent reductase (Old Yellow Enzyme family)